MKLSELINLEFEIVKGPFEEYKSKYDPDKTKPSFVGEAVDFKRHPEEEGNFHFREVKKGVKKPDWVWTVEAYDYKKWDQFFSYTIEVNGKTEYIQLSWSANEELKEAVGINQYDKIDTPVKVKLKKPDKAYEFEVMASADQFDNMEEATVATPAQEGPPDNLPF